MALKVEWRSVIEGRELNTGDNSQIRTAMVETTDLTITGVVTLRKWAKYCTSVEKQSGLTKENVPYRPTKDGISFPASAIPAIIEDLQRIYKEAEKRGVADYTPISQKPAQPAPPPAEEEKPHAVKAKPKRVKVV